MAQTLKEKPMPAYVAIPNVNVYSEVATQLALLRTNLMRISDFFQSVNPDLSPDLSITPEQFSASPDLSKATYDSFASGVFLTLGAFNGQLCMLCDRLFIGPNTPISGADLIDQTFAKDSS
jgi:hypothetical protein